MFQMEQRKSPSNVYVLLCLGIDNTTLLNEYFKTFLVLYFSFLENFELFYFLNIFQRVM